MDEKEEKEGGKAKGREGGLMERKEEEVELNGMIGRREEGNSKRLWMRCCVNEYGVAFVGRFFGIDFCVRRVQGWKEGARNRKKRNDVPTYPREKERENLTIRKGGRGEKTNRASTCKT